MRPPVANCFAMRSIPLAICGRAFVTARGTFWSSRLMSRAIARALMVSSAAAARFRRSVPSCWKRDFLFAIECFDHGIVEARPQFFDRLVLAVGPGAIGQQRNRELALRIDPQRCAGETQVPVRPGIKMLPGLRRLRWRIPTEGARSAGRRFFAPREELDGLPLEDRCAAAHQAMCELGEIA